MFGANAFPHTDRVYPEVSFNLETNDFRQPHLCPVLMDVELHGRGCGRL